jgi:hypothetical protein
MGKSTTSVVSPVQVRQAPDLNEIGKRAETRARQRQAAKKVAAEAAATEKIDDEHKSLVEKAEVILLEEWQDRHDIVKRCEDRAGDIVGGTDKAYDWLCVPICQATSFGMHLPSDCYYCKYYSSKNVVLAHVKAQLGDTYHVCHTHRPGRLETSAGPTVLFIDWSEKKYTADEMRALVGRE